MSRILALDLGEKQIGIAISDSLQIIASPLQTIRRRSRQEDFSAVGEICRREKVSFIIIGLPIMMDGSEGPMANWVRDYGQDLSQSINLPIIFWDESFTSDMAVEALQAQGFNRRKMKQKGLLDAVAAALILQNYLETKRGTESE